MGETQEVEVKRSKQGLVTAGLCFGLFVVVSFLLQIGGEIATRTGAIAVLLGLIGLIKPIKWIGFPNRWMGLYVLVLGLVLIFNVAGDRRAAQDELLAGLKESDEEAYLAKVKELRGDDAWLEALQEVDPERHQAEFTRRRLREAAKAEEKTALEIRREYDERCRSASARVYAYHAIQRFVAQQLKAPSTAEFPSDHDIAIRPTGTCTFEIDGYVDAQNSFGATLRTRYVGAVTRQEGGDGGWQLDTLRVNN